MMKHSSVPDILKWIWGGNLTKVVGDELELILAWFNGHPFKYLQGLAMLDLSYQIWTYSWAKMPGRLTDSNSNMDPAMDTSMDSRLTVALILRSAPDTGNNFVRINRRISRHRGRSGSLHLFMMGLRVAPPSPLCPLANTIVKKDTDNLAWAQRNKTAVQ